ncbi:MAG TPA: site-specific integrase [Methanocorpusculum sp.]|nr:site-specific integrase [Methanocorpusculum sp.]HJJ39711.1 site-specific integrase [Methanocorpusculum sp.]HJJ49320.1 site-specific integrase [Methanocorpusculum sp.]HJJ56636.1 site-specific integrase [Methanocorpusculum sp.]
MDKGDLNQKYHSTDEKNLYWSETAIQTAIREGRISESDAKLINNFFIREGRKMSPRRQLSTTSHLISLRRFFDMDYAEVDDDAYYLAQSRIKTGVSLKRTKPGTEPKPLTQNSRAVLYRTLKRFFRVLNERGETKVSIKAINDTILERMNTETKTTDDVYSAEEIERLIDAAKSLRYKAYIATLYETGGRSIEIANLKWKDINVQQWGIEVRLTDTKTDKFRYVPITTYSKYLIDWRNNYAPGNPDPNNFVFVTPSGRPLRYASVSKALKEIAERAGIDKPVTLHRFRHSRITHMLQEGMSETVAKKAYWGNLRTPMIATYGHLTNQDVRDAVLGISGVEVPGQKKAAAPKPVTCPKCNRIYPPGTQYCSECGTGLTKEAIKAQQSKEEKIEKLAEILDIDEILKLKKYLSMVDSNESKK